MEDDLITRDEVAEILGISRHSIQHRVRIGCLHPILTTEGGKSLHRKWLFSRTAVEAIRDEWHPSPRKQAIYGKSPTRDDCIYFAAFVDGEGCIGIRTRRFANHIPQHQSFLKVINTHQGVMEWAHATFGGNYYEQRIRPKAWRPCYILQMAGYSVIPVLHLIRPFLRVKAEQADLAIELQERLSASGCNQWHRPSLEELEWRESIKQQISLLNRPQTASSEPGSNSPSSRVPNCKSG